MPPTALTRQVSGSMQECELTHFARTPIDIPLARRQHTAYENALRALGCQVVTLPELPDLPDSVFIEDVALVFDELAIITRPGAESRRAETGSMAAALSPYRRLYEIVPPGAVDGGDVLRLGKQVFVGQSTRSNPAAVEQMGSILAPHGYTVFGVPVTGCLHLKSAVTQIDEHALLLNPAWVNPELFPNWEIVEVDPSEPYAANAVYIPGTGLLYPAAFPRTLARLQARSLHIEVVDVSEVQKAEGAVTCCSLILK